MKGMKADLEPGMKSRWIVLALALGLIAVGGFVHAQEKTVRQSLLTSEEGMFVKIEGGLGSFLIRKGDPNTAYTLVQAENDSKNTQATITYEVQNKRGVLTIDLNSDHGEGGISDIMHLFKGTHGGRWRLELTDKIPIDLDMEFGAGEANLDLTGLNITGLNIETGASSLVVRSASLNPGRIRTLSISAGLGSIESESLGNLNFEHFRFEGGLGSYQLDLTGALRDGARIRAEVGLGSLDIQLPEHVGVMARCEDSFLSSSKFHQFVRVNDNVYQTPNYRSAARKVKLNVESGIGSVSVKTSARSGR